MASFKGCEQGSGVTVPKLKTIINMWITDGMQVGSRETRDSSRETGFPKAIIIILVI